MALNPVERKDFILTSMPIIAQGFIDNPAVMNALDHRHSRGAPTRREQLLGIIYNHAVDMADKYDLENP